MNTETKKITIIILFLIAIIIGIVGWAWPEDMRILPMRGPIGTAKISPANGSATAYRMDFSGQKVICLQSVATTSVYIGSHTAISTNGWGLLNKGDSICIDLQGGTTIYLVGDGAGADVRAIIAR